MNATLTRDEVLDVHGRAIGEERLALIFTDSLEGDGAKIVNRKGWHNTPRLADANHGAAMMLRARRRNPAIALRSSGLVGIDVDGKEGEALMQQLQPVLEPTVVVKTARGWHIWYRASDDVEGVAKIELGRLGVTASVDGYLVAPPAIHPSGFVYRFAHGHAPWDRPIATISRHQLQPFLDHAKTDRGVALTNTGPIPEGGRHKHLLRLGGAMRRVGAGEDAIRAALLAENEHRCVPPQDGQAVRDLARDIANRYQPAL